MKTCPECAESVQDAARKCRFCDYRFDAPSDATPASEAGPPAVRPAPTAPGAWPFTTAAIGGGAFGLGAVGHALHVLTAGPLDPGPLGFVSVVALFVGGLVLAIGWTALLVRGHAGLGPVLGSFAVPVAGVVVVVLRNDPDGALIAGLVIEGALAALAIAHWFALGEPAFARLGVARGGAAVALVGIGGEIFAIARALELPPVVFTLFAVVGFGGLALLGFGLAAGLPAAGRRLASPH